MKAHISKIPGLKFLKPSLCNRGRIFPMRFFVFSEALSAKTGGFFLSVFLLISCGESEILIDFASKKPDPTAFQKPEPKERALIAVNDMFTAIIDNKSPAEMEKISLTAGNSLNSLNKKGDTPLGTAIKFRREDLALFFLDKLQCESLHHKNNKQEGYIYLSAKYGHARLINRIADKCYERKKVWTSFSDYEFSDLDTETADGERAVHSAYNRAVMEALEAEYNRGFGEYPWLAFHKTNNRGETFFHTACKNRRDSVLEWGVQTYCHENSWEKSDNLFKRLSSSIPRYGWNIPQTHIPPSM